MFNLDKAMAQWRQQMLAVGIKSPEVLDELETHLREDVERQTKSGTSALQAFDFAVQNLGKANLLKNEFRKTSRASSAMEKLMIGICVVFVGFIVLLSAITVFLCYASWVDRVMASAAVTCILLVACGWRLAVPFLPMISNRRARWGIGLTCIAGGFIASSLYCQFILPHFEFGPDHQLPAIGVWAVFLIEVFACTGVGLLLTERQREIWKMNRLPRQGS